MSIIVPQSIRPILLYHKVDPRWDLAITNLYPHQFQRQLDAILEAKKVLTTMEDALSSQSPKNAVGLTFDDGFDSIKRYAFPLLQPHNFTGTVFLIANSLGKRNRWDAKLGFRSFRHLDNNEVFSLIFEGWRIGSHGLTHTALTLLSETEARREIFESKERLEQYFGQPVMSIAFPFGRVTQKHLEAALEVGYRWLCVPFVRSEWPEEIKRACVVRRGVYWGETRTMFREKISNEPLPFIHEKKLLYVNKMAGGTVLIQTIRRLLT